jgi:hypothetical protein
MIVPGNVQAVHLYHEFLLSFKNVIALTPQWV